MAADDHAILYVADPASVAVIRCSPPSWMARIVLEEKRVDYELVALAFDKGEHRTPWMQSLNPRGTVPVLEHAGHVVHETYAILDYLDFAIPDPPLLPVEPAKRAIALTRYHEAAALKQVGMVLFAAMMRGASGDDLVAPRERFTDELLHWERYTPKDGHLAGDFSLADVVVFPYIATAAQLSIALPAKLLAYRDRLRDRPSIAATWPSTWNESSTVIVGRSTPR